MSKHTVLAFSALALALVATTSSVASAQRCLGGDTADMAGAQRYCGTTLIDGLGGPAGFGTVGSAAPDGCLSQNDDGSSPRLDIGAYFPGGLRFFDTTHTSLFVNTNGNITFSDRLSTFTPDAFPVAARPMIAPFWADVDTRMADGSCGEPGATTCTSCTPCYSTTQNQVWWHFSVGRAVFTWDEVGYYNCMNDRRMSFQLILTSVPGCAGAGDFDVEFRFNRCEWETGGASGGIGGFGGTPAQSGFDAGNDRDFVEIMGSRAPNISRVLCEDSNVMEPGIWRFQIRSGVVLCPDAGDACTVAGVMGACALGRTNCVGGGTECVQQVMPSAERCDNLDNDCDGMADEDDGTPLCGSFEVCIAGACVDGCFEGSCPAGLMCSAEGRCVDPACAGITCAAGERCVGGTCVEACSGVVCPRDQSCVAGRCVDGCAGITCDDCTVCEEGTCAARCEFSACAGGSTCQPDGHCVEDACVGVSCSGGSYCLGGACVDACEGVACPFGEMCTMGACIPAERPDAAVVPVDADFHLDVDTGVSFPDTGMVADMDGGVVSAADTGARRMRTAGGCACGVVSANEGRGGGLSLMMIGLAFVAIVRARRRR